MTNQENRPMDPANLRKKAEALALERAARPPEDSAALSPEEIRKTLHELRVHQIELEMQNEELRTAQAEIEAERERYFDLYDLAPVGYCTLSEKGLILEANLTAATLLGTTRGLLVKQPMTRFILKEDQDIYYLHRKKLLETGEPQKCDLRLTKPDGACFWAHLKATAAQAEDGAPVCRVVLSDITERKQAETYREMGQEILQILNDPGDLQMAIQRVLTALKTRTGVDAAGLRLQEGDDFPYFVQDGFSKDFLLTENTLLERDKDGGVCRDKDGNARLECTCGLVISGKTDPSNPLFTPGGSCWTNDSFSLLELPSDQDPRMHPRNNCIHQGFASVALIPVRIQDQMYSRETCARHGFRSLAQVPVRTRDRIVGLIQLNDKRKGRFTLETIELLEGIAAHIGSTLLRKRVEDALRESEQFRGRVIQSLASGLYVYNLEKSHNDFISDQYTVLTGWTLDEIHEMGQRFIELFHPEDRPRVEEHFRNIQKAEDGEVLEIEYRFRTKDGRWIWCISRDTVFERNEHGDITRFIGSYFDITERVKLQTQLNQAQKMEAIGTLAGGIAHDFNNILYPLMGFTEMLKEDVPSDSPLHSHIDEILQASFRAKDLVKQIMAFSRQGEQELKPIKLQPIIKEALKLLRSSIPTTIDIEQEIDPACGFVVGDPTQIHQIIMNLATNAYYAMEETGGQLTVLLEQVRLEPEQILLPEMAPGDYARLRVTDTGPGIEKDQLDKIFDPYFTTKETGKGTGLGLSVVQGIVKRCHGDVRVISEPGQGFEVQIFLPVKEQIFAERHIDPDQPVRGGTEKILLVDDEASIVKMEKQILERLGYTVTVRTGSLDALEAFKNDPRAFDLVVTDMTMPNMTGVQLSAELKKISPAIPVILCTGFSYQVNEEKSKALGIDGFVMKPVIMKEIAATIRKVLDKKKD